MIREMIKVNYKFEIAGIYLLFGAKGKSILDC